MNILLEMFNDSDYVSAAPHSAGLNVFDLESRQVRQTAISYCLDKRLAKRTFITRMEILLK